MNESSFITNVVSIASTTFFASIVLGLCYFFMKLAASRRFIHKLQKAKLPMPKYNALSGHLLVLKEQVDRLPADCTINTPFLMMAKDYPDGIFYFDLWPISNPLLILSTTSASLQLAQAPLDKPEQVNAAFQHLTGGENLFTMPEAAWKPWRNLFNPGFSSSYMLELVPAIAKETKVFHQILRQHTESAAIVQLENLTLKLTIDVIGAVAIDTRFHYQLKDHAFASALRTQIEWTSFGAELNPFARYNPLRPLILWYNNRRIDHYIHAEIDKRFMELKDNYLSDSETRPSKSIISLALYDFMKAKGLEGTDKVDTEFRDIAAAQLRLFLFAGHDTTSSTLIYCYHLLATHPEPMAQIRAEHNEVFGTDSKDTYQKLLQKPQLLNQLPYTLAVIKEALRLFPPASGFRAGRSDISIVDDNGKIYPTEGCSVWAMHLIIQRNPKYWKDPNIFNPERWLVGPDHPLYPVKGAWRPFEFGPRNCLGQTLAVMELKVVLAMTIRDFEIQPAYDRWDKERNATHTRTVLGNRAYQVEGGGGGAHPADRYPCKISFRA